MRTALLNHLAPWTVSDRIHRRVARRVNTDAEVRRLLSIASSPNIAQKKPPEKKKWVDDSKTKDERQYENHPQKFAAKKCSHIITNVFRRHLVSTILRVLQCICSPATDLTDPSRQLREIPLR